MKMYAIRENDGMYISEGDTNSTDVLELADFFLTKEDADNILYNDGDTVITVEVTVKIVEE